MKQKPAKEPRRRQITAADINSMARLLAKRITETGACQILGIKVDTWYKFKCKGKNESRFAKALDHARETRLLAHIENIEQAAIGAGPHARADFRASVEVLKQTAPDRFSDRHQEGQAVTQVAISIDMAGVIGQMVQERLAKEGRIAAVVTDIQPTMLAHTTQEGSSGNAVK